MDEETEDLCNRLALSALNALVEASMVDGDEQVYVPLDHAAEAVIRVLAILIEASPKTVGAKRLREAGEAAARDLQLQLKKVRQIQETTGRRALHGLIVNPN